MGGQPRVQLALLDASGVTATVAPWLTNRYDRAHSSCAVVLAGGTALHMSGPS